MTYGTGLYSSGTYGNPLGSFALTDTSGFVEDDYVTPVSEVTVGSPWHFRYAGTGEGSTTLERLLSPISSHLGPVTKVEISSGTGWVEVATAAAYGIREVVNNHSGAVFILSGTAQTVGPDGLSATFFWEE